jgi:uncharacterized protein
MENITMFVKPAGDSCNLHCKYCFVESEMEKSPIMDTDTLRKSMELVKDVPNVIIVYHGGEPMLAGHDFFEEANFLKKSIIPEAKTSIQTNLTLLDENWINIFQNSGITIGTSIDGTEDIHDAIRMYPDGKGSYQDVLDNVKWLNEAGFNVGAIATFTRFFEGRGKEVYHTMTDCGIGRWKLNPMVNSGWGNEEEIGADISRLVETYLEIADEYFWDKTNIQLVTVDNLLKSYFLAKRGIKQRFNCQLSEMCVHSDGSIYPCSRMTEMPEYALGTVDDNLDDIFSHPTKQEMGKDYEGCVECEYDITCRPRCPYNSLASHGEFGKKDHMCVLYKSFYHHMDKILKGEVNESGNRKGLLVTGQD